MLTKLFRFKKVLFFLIITFVLHGCGKPGTDHWSGFVPETTPFVVVPDEDTTISDVLGAPFIPFFDDISPSAIQLISNIQVDENSDSSLPVEAILLYSDTSNDWQPLWITTSQDGLIDYLTRNYQRDFEQNRYDFKSHTIEKLFFSDRVIFITEVGNYTLFSESSLALENVLRTVAGEINPMELNQEQVRPGSFIANTDNLERWIHQLAQVSYRPNLMNIFEGGAPVVLQPNNSPENGYSWQLTGNMEVNPGISTLLKSISSAPAPFTLDQFIPVNTAAFSIFRLPVIPDVSDDIEYNSDLDNFLQSNRHILNTLGAAINEEAAFAAFAESGAESTSEYIFLRSISNPSAIRSELDELDSQNLVIKDQNTYAIQSDILRQLFGSKLNPMTDFYVTVYNQTLAIAQRKGLAESIGGDAERRRVVYYDDDYSRIRNSLSDPLSSFHYVNAPRFGQFVQPWLNPQNYMNAIVSNLDQFVISTRLDSEQSSLQIDMTSFQRETTDQPYREQWSFPLGGAELTGKPILADITGSSRNELIFSTDNGYVYALATDGTVVLQMPTNNDEPIGSPVAYDWYGNNQNIIMQAAGDKVYAWNNNGTLLPNFPVVLNETITTPLTVMDITRNGIPEMILSTADRNTHVLNSRGQAINGWPRNTNSSVHSEPLITEWQGQQSLFVFSENALHAWNVNGQTREGFPVFLNTQIQGSPTIYENHLLGAGLDGNLYSIGTEPLFSETVSDTQMNNSIYIQALSVSNSSLNSKPTSYSILQRNDEGFFREELILTQSSNGSLFLYNKEGELRFTHSLGQPSSDTFAPLIVDLDNNQRDDLVALADFGRFYAWDLLSGGRLYDLPTTGMNYPIINDFLGNGQNEIIGQTRDGIQCWTIYRTRREAPDS